jgi:hypothetical protein
MLAPTPPDRLVDPQGRPYVLWDVDMTLAEFVMLSRSELRDLIFRRDLIEQLLADR